MDTTNNDALILNNDELKDTNKCSDVTCFIASNLTDSILASSYISKLSGLVTRMNRVAILRCTIVLDAAWDVEMKENPAK